ncbi:MAG: SDR family oxidoreductase [Dehalococcoidia bacterium]|nr:SDR family oxidoreductase [Dehalococcoidia bacterium]
MRDLTGRVVLMTGAAGGIGPRIVRALIKERTHFVLAALPTPELDELVIEIRNAGLRAIAVPTDVTDRDQLERLVQAAEAEFGRIDILMNNAGIETAASYHKLRPEQIERLIAVNFQAPMMLTHMVLPGMLERRTGHIVCMSSYVGRAAAAYLEPYCATKGGLIPFVSSLRASYRGTGVSASVIMPGVIRAGMAERWEAESGKRAPRLAGATTAEAVARAVVTAIKRDKPEVLVTSVPSRIVTTLAEASPRFGEWVTRAIGENRWLRTIAERRDRELDQQAASDDTKAPAGRHD